MQKWVARGDPSKTVGSSKVAQRDARTGPLPSSTRVNLGVAITPPAKVDSSLSSLRTTIAACSPWYPVQNSRARRHAGENYN